jgi:peptide/nickel transport system permease protein
MSESDVPQGRPGPAGGGEAPPDAASVSLAGPWSVVFAQLRRDKVAVGSVGVIAVVCLLAIFAPLVARLVGHGPNTQYLQTGLSPDGIPKGPSLSFLFGTDDVGRDVFVRVIYGARVSLVVGVVATSAAIVIGVVIGLVAGYYGRVVDTVLARFMDVVLSLPYLILAIALVSLVGPSLWISIAVIAFFSWATVGRVVRGQTLSVKEREFVEAARSLGASDVRIMFSEILPNIMAPVIVYATLLIPAAIVFEATLSFLGLGIVPPTPSWGNMLSESLQYYQVAWWFVVFPGAALLATTLAFNLLGDSVRDALDASSASGGR